MLENLVKYIFLQKIVFQHNSRNFQIVLSDSECFENNKKFLVISIVAKLGRVEDIEIKDYQINLIIQIHNGQDNSESIAKSICFYNELSIRDLV